MNHTRSVGILQLFSLFFSLFPVLFSLGGIACTLTGCSVSGARPVLSKHALTPRESIMAYHPTEPYTVVNNMGLFWGELGLEGQVILNSQQDGSQTLLREFFQSSAEYSRLAHDLSNASPSTKLRFIEALSQANPRPLGQAQDRKSNQQHCQQKDGHLECVLGLNQQPSFLVLYDLPSPRHGLRHRLLIVWSSSFQGFQDTTHQLTALGVTPQSAPKGTVENVSPIIQALVNNTLNTPLDGRSDAH